MEKELKNIIETGIYTFELASRACGGKSCILLEYTPSSKPVAVESSSVTQMATQMERWGSEQINDFVLKLGFLDAQGEGGYQIKRFLHVNEVRNSAQRNITVH
jgi:hypothetical protein